MSNHHHTGVVDVDGRLPDFLAHFHKLIAKHQNALHGRWEAMLAPEQNSAVELVEPQDIFEMMRTPSPIRSSITSSKIPTIGLASAPSPQPWPQNPKRQSS